MKFLSVCSGIEAASVAWQQLGWEAVAFSEIDRFPCAVLAHHYPSVPNWGDLTKFREWPDATVDVLVGGTPCQSFSVAGLRQGLADPRGNLALMYLACVDKYRPRWVVWENVPGALSVDDGGVLGAFLGGLSKLGYGWAYRSLDAQYFGLAQRRLRVFVVGYFGDWRRAAAVLFEPESLSGHPAPRRETGQNVPSLPSRRTAGGGLGTDFDCDGGLIPSTGRGTPLVSVANTIKAYSGRNQIEKTYLPVAFDARQSDVIQYGEISGPLDTDGHTIGLLHDTLTSKGISHASTQETNASSLLRALRQEVGAEAFTQWGLGILDSLLQAEVLRPALHGCGVRLAAFSRRWLVYHALSRAEAHSEGLVLAMREAEREGCASQGWRPSEQLARELGAYLSELSQPGAQAARFMRDLWQAAEGLGLLRQALSAVQEVGRSVGREGEPARDGMQVRRLTAEECEFLQGFPRGYTAIPYRGKPAADGPRYKALGNSMAVPVVRWIGERIALVESVLAEHVA